MEAAVQQLDGKVAVITASTRSLGRAMAETFLREGASVVISSRDAEKGAAALKEIDAGERAHFIAADVTGQADVDALIDGAVAHFGRIDILVNNAGGSNTFGPVAETTNEMWQHTMDWNLNATFWGCRRALHHMIPQKSGRIINMSSVEGKHGKPNMVAYVTAKHGLHGMTKVIAKEVGPVGITCNAICPGLVATDAYYENGVKFGEAYGITLDDMAAMYSAEAPIGRLNTHEEVAAVALLLASPAGGGITGTTISVDGGTAAY